MRVLDVESFSKDHDENAMFCMYLRGAVCSGSQFHIWFAKINSSKRMEMLETRY